MNTSEYEEYFLLPTGELIRPGDQIHPLTVTPDFAKDDDWHNIEEGTIFIGAEVGKVFCGILLKEGGFRRPRCKEMDTLVEPEAPEWNDPNSTDFNDPSITGPVKLFGRYTEGGPPDVTSSSSVILPNWEYQIAEEFRVKRKSEDSDIWLVGRRGKPSFQVSYSDIQKGGRGYHYDRIPYKCIIHAISQEMEREQKTINREKHKQYVREAIQKADEDRRLKYEESLKPKTLRDRIVSFLKKHLNP